MRCLRSRRFGRTTCTRKFAAPWLSGGSLVTSCCSTIKYKDGTRVTKAAEYTRDAFQMAKEAQARVRLLQPLEIHVLCAAGEAGTYQDLHDMMTGSLPCWLFVWVRSGHPSQDHVPFPEQAIALQTDAELATWDPSVPLLDYLSQLPWFWKCVQCRRLFLRCWPDEMLRLAALSSSNQAPLLAVVQHAGFPGSVWAESPILHNMFEQWKPYASSHCPHVLPFLAWWATTARDRDAQEMSCQHPVPVPGMEEGGVVAVWFCAQPCDGRETLRQVFPIVCQLLDLEDPGGRPDFSLIQWAHMTRTVQDQWGTQSEHSQLALRFENVEMVREVWTSVSLAVWWPVPMLWPIANGVKLRWAHITLGQLAEVVAADLPRPLLYEPHEEQTPAIRLRALSPPP